MNKRLQVRTSAIWSGHWPSAFMAPLSSASDEKRFCALNMPHAKARCLTASKRVTRSSS